MKSISPKFSLLIIAVMLAVIASVSIIIFTGSYGEVRLHLALFGFTVSFATSFILLLCINGLLFKKIKRLFVTVKNFRTNGDHVPASPVYTGNEVDNLYQEIL